jgi:hypothetical protein
MSAILPETEEGRAIMYVIDGILSDDDMPCGFDYDNAAEVALKAAGIQQLWEERRQARAEADEMSARMKELHDRLGEMYRFGLISARALYDLRALVDG